MSGTGRNLSDSLRFREAVGFFLILSGLDDARARPTLRKVSDALGSEPQPDVIGVPDTWIETSNRVAYRIGGDVDEARRMADATGQKHAVLIQHRSGRSLGDSLVCMTLSDWSALITPPG